MTKLSPQPYFEADDEEKSSVRRQRLLDKMRVLTTTLNSFSYEEPVKEDSKTFDLTDSFDSGAHTTPDGFPRMTLPISRATTADDNEWDPRLLEQEEELFDDNLFTNFGDLVGNAHPQPPEMEFGGTSETQTTRRRASMSQASRRSQKLKMQALMSDCTPVMEEENSVVEAEPAAGTASPATLENSLATRMSLTLPSSCFADFGAFDTEATSSQQQQQQQPRRSKIHLLQACNPLKDTPNDDFVVGAVSRDEAHGSHMESHLQLVLPPISADSSLHQQDQLEKTPSRTRQLLTSCNPRHREESTSGNRAFVPVPSRSVSSASRSKGDYSSSTTSRGDGLFVEHASQHHSPTRRSKLAGCYPLKDHPEMKQSHVFPLPPGQADMDVYNSKKKALRKRSLYQKVQLVTCFNPLRESVPEEVEEEDSLDKDVLQSQPVNGAFSTDIFKEAHSVWENMPTSTTSQDPQVFRRVLDQNTEQYALSKNQPETVDSKFRGMSLHDGAQANKNTVDFPNISMEKEKLTTGKAGQPQDEFSNSVFEPFEAFPDDDFDCMAREELPVRISISEKVDTKTPPSPVHSAHSTPSKKPPPKTPSSIISVHSTPSQKPPLKTPSPIGSAHSTPSRKSTSSSRDITPSPVRSAHSTPSRTTTTSSSSSSSSSMDVTPVRRNKARPQPAFQPFEDLDDDEEDESEMLGSRPQEIDVASRAATATSHDMSSLSPPPPITNTSKNESKSFFQPFVDFVDNLDGGGSVVEDEYSTHAASSYASICATSLGDGSSSVSSSSSREDDDDESSKMDGSDVDSVSVQVQKHIPKVLNLQDNDEVSQASKRKVPKSISALEVDRPVSPMNNDEDGTSKPKFDPLPCACGRQEECNGISAAFFMLSDERAGYIQVPDYRENAESHFDLETNRLRQALLRPFHSEEETGEEREQRYVANHHFHPGIISSQSTKGSTSILPMYISKMAMVSLNLQLSEEDQVLDGKGVPTGFYYVVPKYGVEECKTDLKKAIKARRVKLENSRRKRQQKILEEQETSLFGSALTNALTTTPGLAWYDKVY